MLQFIRLLIVFFIFIYPSSALSDLSKFSQHYQYDNIKISPDGNHLAISRFVDGSSEMFVVKSDTLESVNRFSFRMPDQVGTYYWVNNDRLVIKVFDNNDLYESPVYYGELFSINAFKKRGLLIFGQRILHRKAKTVKQNIIKQRHIAMRASWADILDLLPNDREHILIEAYPYTESKPKKARLYKINVYDASIHSVAEAPTTRSDIFTDSQGVPDFAISYFKEDQQKLYRFKPEDKSWQLLRELDINVDFKSVVYDPLENKLAYLDRDDKGIQSLFEIDLSSNASQRKLLFNNPEKDVDWINTDDNNRNIYGISSATEYPEFHFLDLNKDHQQILKMLTGNFKGYHVKITSSSKDMNKLVFQVWSDRDPGRWYLLDIQKKKIKPLALRTSMIKPEEMQPKHAFDFVAKDGTKVHGYLTPPKSKKKNMFPAVVLVHGGPFEVRDSWVFERDVQMLASQGYLVIQINFRGSSGRGLSFIQSGFGHWQDDIQQDLKDGLDFLIDNSIVDKNRVCIVGSSFGGYSALQSSLLFPESYKCAVAVAGVYDLESLYKHDMESKIPLIRRFWRRTIGKDKSNLKKYSPIINLEKLNTPILLVHGGRDERVPVEQMEDLVDRLDELNKIYQEIEFEDEGHGIYSEDNRLTYYTQLIKFLNKYNPPD